MFAGICGIRYIWEHNMNKLWLSQFRWKPENHPSFDSWLDFLVPKPIDCHYFWGSSSSWDPPSTPLCPKIFDQCSTFDLSKPRGGCWNGRYIFTEIIYRDTVDGTNAANQLRLAVYIIIHRVFYIPGGAGFLPSAVYRILLVRLLASSLGKACTSLWPGGDFFLWFVPVIQSGLKKSSEGKLDVSGSRNKTMFFFLGQFRRIWSIWKKS